MAGGTSPTTTNSKDEPRRRCTSTTASAVSMPRVVDITHNPSTSVAGLAQPRRSL